MKTDFLATKNKQIIPQQQLSKPEKNLLYGLAKPVPSRKPPRCTFKSCSAYNWGLSTHGLLST